MIATPLVEAIDFRLLVPMLLDRAKVYRGAGLPCTAVVSDDGWKYEHVVWPHKTYTEEVFPPVRNFLFSQVGLTGSFACWQVELAQATPWFGKTAVTIDSTGEKSAKVGLHSKSGIEVFLSDLGVGLLSVSLHLTEFPDLVWVRQLLHNLATAEEPAAQRQYPVTFSRPARKVDLAAVPPERHSQVRQPPGRHDRMSERLIREGGVYDWNELREYLLDPLAKAFGAQTTDRRAWCHSVLRLSGSHDFQRAEDRRAVKPVLSALAQLHPQTHPGEVTGRPHAQFFTVNRTHLAAVSLTGAAHAVARQHSEPAGEPAAHPYDDLHLLRAHNTYFVPYLLASLQRLALHQFLEEAQKSLSAPAPHAPAAAPAPAQVAPREPRLLDLRRAVVRFGLTGEQLEISQRGTLQRYYGVARNASAVPSAFAQLRAVISEWDGIERAERLHETAQQLRENVESLERLQGEVGWVEVVIISVYVVQLAQIIGYGFGFAGSPWHGLSLLLLSMLALALAWLCGFFPGRHKGEGRLQKLVFVGVFVLIALYVGVNHFFSPPFAKTVSNHGPAVPADEEHAVAIPPGPVPERIERGQPEPVASKALAPAEPVCPSAIRPPQKNASPGP
jgi:hypothetical protein